MDYVTRRTNHIQPMKQTGTILAQTSD